MHHLRFGQSRGRPSLPIREDEKRLAKQQYLPRRERWAKKRFIALCAFLLTFIFYETSHWIGHQQIESSPGGSQEPIEIPRIEKVIEATHEIDSQHAEEAVDEMDEIALGHPVTIDSPIPTITTDSSDKREEETIATLATTSSTSITSSSSKAAATPKASPVPIVGEGLPPGERAQLLPEFIHIPFEDAVADETLEGWEDDWWSEVNYDAEKWGNMEEPKIDFVYLCKF